MAKGAPPLKAEPVHRLTRPLVKFLQIEATSGLLLVACTIIALTLANSPFADSVAHFWHNDVAFSFGGATLSHSLAHWVNDALMAIFFFVIGLEIKREITSGELREPRKMVLPVAAAIGGAVLPALVYVALQAGKPGAGGWAIPMATDIAFVVGVLALFGPRVPGGLKVFMLSLAIVDDIIAVVVIALFFTAQIHTSWLVGIVVGLLVTGIMNRLGVRAVGAYVMVGAITWLCALKSGIHPTVAGVALGLMTPSGAYLTHTELRTVVGESSASLDATVPAGDRFATRVTLERLATAARETLSPLERLEKALHPWVSFAIMPVFALANAGVAISVGAASDSIAVAVACGLFIGKPVGIFLSSFVVVRVGLASLPSGVTWKMIIGGACLGGIGFTMSLFVAALGLAPELQDPARIGVLVGSTASAALGMGILWAVLPKREAADG